MSDSFGHSSAISGMLNAYIVFSHSLCEYVSYLWKVNQCFQHIAYHLTKRKRSKSNQFSGIMAHFHEMWNTHLDLHRNLGHKFIHIFVLQYRAHFFSGFSFFSFIFIWWFVAREAHTELLCAETRFPELPNNAERTHQHQQQVQYRFQLHKYQLHRRNNNWEREDITNHEWREWRRFYYLICTEWPLLLFESQHLRCGWIAWLFAIESSGYGNASADSTC